MKVKQSPNQRFNKLKIEDDETYQDDVSSLQGPDIRSVITSQLDYLLAQHSPKPSFPIFKTFTYEGPKLIISINNTQKESKFIKIVWICVGGQRVTWKGKVVLLMLSHRLKSFVFVDCCLHILERTNVNDLQVCIAEDLEHRQLCHNRLTGS